MPRIIRLRSRIIQRGYPVNSRVKNRFLAFLLVPLLLVSSALSAVIVEIDTVGHVVLSDPSDTLILFDIDDTLIDSSGMIGSKAWREYIKEATQGDKRRNWHDVLTLFVARHYPVSAVEPSTPDFIQTLQASGHLVFGLTSRERNRWYDTPVSAIDRLTAQQLRSVGIDLSRTELPPQYAYLQGLPEYYDGILFADTDSKGEYVVKMLQNAAVRPKRIIFVDDRESHVSSVDKALKKLGIESASYVYGATDPKSEQFTPVIANTQLYYLWKFGTPLSDEEAALASINDAKDASWYLRSVLDECVSPSQ